MIVYFTFLMLVVAYAAARTQRRYHPSFDTGQNERRLFTFLVDPATFLFVGLVVPMVTMINRKKRKLTKTEFVSRKRLTDALLVLFALSFWVMEGLTYFDVMGHPFDPTKSGNDFMWNGYLDMLFGPLFTITSPTYESAWWNLLAIGLWLLQPAALWLGRSLGYNSAFFNDLNNWSRPKRS